MADQLMLSNRYFRNLSDNELAESLTFGVSTLKGINIGRAWREYKRRSALRKPID